MKTDAKTMLIAVRHAISYNEADGCVRRFGDAADAVIVYAQSVNLDPLTFPPSPKSTEAQR